MHEFGGKWITDGEFCSLEPRNVFFKQLKAPKLDCSEHRNCHILFRKKFFVNKFDDAKIYITADDYYKLYINGRFVAQGPAPSYHFQYNYNVIDITGYLKDGENTVAVHTLYQGLINRVWQSGDNRHGFICDIMVDGSIAAASDESFKTARHTAYRELGTVGYQTQFMEEYDSRDPICRFAEPDFDDSEWENARISECSDHKLAEQLSHMLVFEDIAPVVVKRNSGRLFIDFGSAYVGYLCAGAKGSAGDTVTVLCGQELNEDGTVRYTLRCNCKYEEKWILSGGNDTLDQFDYKSFRYAELLVLDGVEITDVKLCVRHYPFELAAEMNPEYCDDERLKAIWELCVHTQKYGVQEVIQDCMEREKGFYVGDGCFTALANMILTGDDSMVRKLIDDAFVSSFITDGLVTCLDCSFMQEIAEYPLILIYLVMWHYRLNGDIEYLRDNYEHTVRLLESYRRDYERDGVLCNLDKWCVVDWPANFRDGYAVEITEGKVCEEPHVAINAYYVEAIRCANKMAELLGFPEYRSIAPITEKFNEAFYDRERHLYKDGVYNDHVSIIGNVFAYAFRLYPDNSFVLNFTDMLRRRKVSSMSFFGSFAAMMGLVRHGEAELIREMLLDDGAWLRILREGGTTTFEGWGRDTKWNTSLFHLTMSYAAIFLSNTDLETLFS